MREKIMQLLDEKVDKIFFEMQNDLGIEHGDIFPIDAFDLDNCKEELAEIIERVLKSQI